ncbi:MAG: DUF4364 family protein [Oscillospiraceae bacterium]|nr:DUF4364 family protein [Oscillospiraceae bacterium]
MERRKPFMQNVRKGGPSTLFDIKVVLCYLLNSLDAPISADDLFLIVQSEQLINYFELMSAISELCKGGQIETSFNEKGEECYAISKHGASLVADLEASIPMNLKHRVVSAAIRMFAFKQNAKENKVQITASENGGYILSVEVPGMPEPLCKLSLYFADRIQAEVAKDNFLENPTLVYTSVLVALTGDRATLITALSDIANLR